MGYGGCEPVKHLYNRFMVNKDSYSRESAFLREAHNIYIFLTTKYFKPAMGKPKIATWMSKWGFMTPLGFRYFFARF